MADVNKQTLGSVIFADIEKNEYLNKLYDNILKLPTLKKLSNRENYTRAKLKITYAARQSACW